MSEMLSLIGPVNIGLALLLTIKSFTGDVVDVVVCPWLAALTLGAGLWLLCLTFASTGETT